jgi:hypothetical protein
MCRPALRPDEAHRARPSGDRYGAIGGSHATDSDGGCGATVQRSADHACGSRALVDIDATFHGEHRPEILVADRRRTRRRDRHRDLRLPDRTAFLQGEQ